MKKYNIGYTCGCLLYTSNRQYNKAADSKICSLFDTLLFCTGKFSVTDWFDCGCCLLLQMCIRDSNWIDENEIYPLDENNEKVLAFKKKYGLDGKFVIMYSGNIGLYLSLIHICTQI